jgi:6-phosphogluconolactonase (cycloisomerase 2 family)
VKRPRSARLLVFLVATVVVAGGLTDAPAARATDHGLTTFSAPLGVAPDPANPGIYKGTVVIGWHANDPCKHWEFNISGTVPAFVEGDGASTQQTTTAVALLQAGQTVTVTGSVLCRFGSLDMPLAGFPTITLTAPPGPPPLPSQLTPDQKNALNKAAAQSALIAAALIAAGLIAAAIVCPPCALIGAFLGAAGAGAGIVSAYKWNQSADPPDPAFTSIEAPRVITMPVMQVGPGVSDDLAAAMNAALANVADQISLSRAFLVALQREWGANVAGDGGWETKQAVAVQDFAGRYADAMARSATLMANVSNLIDAIPSSGLPADIAPNVPAAIASVLANPLPAVWGQLSAQSGQTADDLALAAQRNQALTLGLGTMRGKINATLTSDDGSSDAVAALRALAAKGLPAPGPSKLPMPAPGRGGAGTLKAGPCVTVSARKGCTTGIGISGAAFSAISADGKSMYISGRDEASIGVFRRNVVTGALTQLPGTKGCVHDQSVRLSSGCRAGHALGGVSQLVVSRDGKTVIAAARGSNAISVYKRAKDGSLTYLQCFRDARTTGDPHCKQVVALGDSQSVAISGDGRSVYATGGSTSTLVSFKRNPKTGKLTPAGCLTSSSVSAYASCAPAPVLDGANRLLLSPNGLRLFVAAEQAGAVSEFARDPRTGTLREVSCIGGDDNFVNAACAAGRAIRAPQALTLSPDGKQLYATVTDGIVTLLVNPVSGELSQPAGTAACLSFNESHDPDCGVAGALDGAFGIALAPDGHEAYVGSYNSNAVTQYTRNLTTGALTPISRCVSLDAAGCQHLLGLEHAGWVTISPDGRFVYVNAPYSNAVVMFARRLPLAVPKLVKNKVKVGHGVAHIKLLCPKSAYGGCYGTVTATKGGKAAKAVAYSMAAGKSAAVAVPVGTWRKGTSLKVLAREPAGGKRSGKLKITLS